MVAPTILGAGASGPMTPPPIRYPLPTIVLLVVLGVLVWRGYDWFATVSGPAWAAIDRIRSGPPFPASTEPMRGAGPIVRKVLLLRGGVSATDAPGGEPVETIRRRMFADVYDVWPLRGDPTHYRIGNRRPIGWVEADAVLPWDTRVVLRPTGTSLRLRADPGDEQGERIALDSIPLPVVDWTSDAVRVAVWDASEPWVRVDRRGWVRMEEVPPEAFGVLLTRYELLELLRLAIEPAPGGSPSGRTSAILGTLGSEVGLSDEQTEEVRRNFPEAILEVRTSGGNASVEQLGRLNDLWNPDVTWSGISYQAIPLWAIPGR
jgi:hypothetical protein